MRVHVSLSEAPSRAGKRNLGDEWCSVGHRHHGAQQRRAFEPVILCRLVLAVGKHLAKRMSCPAINVQGNVEQQLGHLDQAEALYLQARSHAIDSGETRLAAMTALRPTPPVPNTAMVSP